MDRPRRNARLLVANAVTCTRRRAERLSPSRALAVDAQSQTDRLLVVAIHRLFPSSSLRHFVVPDSLDGFTGPG